MTVDADREAAAPSWYYCSNCGRDPGSDAGSIDPRWAFCRYCGYQLTALPPFTYAGFWIRVRAYLIDAALLLVVLLLPDVILTLAGARTAAAVMDFVVTLAYFSVGNGLGGTVGRRALGLRVINDSGNAPGIRAGFGLFTLSVLSRLALGLGYLWMVKDRRKQTWHDKLCGTYVVHDPARASRRSATA